jgi:ribonuclease HI
VDFAARLSSGLEFVPLFADGSHYAEAAVGCWVYNLPAFSLVRFGIDGACPSNNAVEFAAVVHGLTAATTIDLTERPIHIHTDSSFVITVMDLVAKRLPLPDRKPYQQVVQLYSQACDVTSGRRFKVSSHCTGNRDHKVCDRKAREELRRYCSADKSVAHRVLLARARMQRRDFIRQVEQVQQTMRNLESKLVRCEMEIAALEYRGGS